MIFSRSDDRVKSVTSELRREYGNGRVSGIAGSVCKQNDVEALVSKAVSDFGTVDVWINNAGSNAYAFRTLIDSSESDLIDIVDTNVLGTMICCQSAIRLMREQPNGGDIFNMDGAGADGNPTPRFAAYGATKRALSQLGKSLQVRHALLACTGLWAMPHARVSVTLACSACHRCHRAACRPS